MSDELVRIPDYCVLRERQEERYPPSPPLLIVEIMSQDDRYSDLREKLEQFRRWGVEHVWVADSHARKLRVYDSSGLRTVGRFELPAIDLTLTPADLFD